MQVIAATHLTVGSRLTVSNFDVKEFRIPAVITEDRKHKAKAFTLKFVANSTHRSVFISVEFADDCLLRERWSAAAKPKNETATVTRKNFLIWEENTADLQ